MAKRKQPTPIVLPDHCPLAGTSMNERIAFLLEVIARNLNGDSPKERKAYRTALGERWNVTPHVVSNMMGEAFRRIKADPEEVDKLRAEALEELRATMADPDPEIRLKAFDRLDRLMQLSPPQKTAVDLNVNAMGEDEMIRRMVRVLEQPDPMTAKALRIAGYTKTMALVEAQGSEVT